MAAQAQRPKFDPQYDVKKGMLACFYNLEDYRHYIYYNAKSLSLAL